MPFTLAFVHTSHVLIPMFTQLAKEHLSGLGTFHMADESLIKNTIAAGGLTKSRSEEHTSELQSQSNLVCRLLLEKKKNIMTLPISSRSSPPSSSASHSTHLLRAQ